MFRCLIVSMFLSYSIVAGQQWTVCNETSKDKPIVVKHGEQIVFETQDYPNGYPGVSCGIILQPENANISINVFFENFLLNPSDTLRFENSAGITLEQLSGNDWTKRRDFVFSTANRPNASGNIGVNLTVQAKSQFGGFRAWVIGYDRTESSANANCGKNITLNAGDSYTYLSPSSLGVQNVSSSVNCTTIIAPANRTVRFRVVVNYLHMNDEDWIVVFDEPNGHSRLDIFSASFYSRFPEIMGNTRLPVQFQLHQPGISSNQSTYFIIVQAFFQDAPACPEDDSMFNLVNDGDIFEGKLMEPFFISTSANNFDTNYENNLHCEWRAVVPDREKYGIAVWFKVFQTEECCDALQIFNLQNFRSQRFSGALVAKNGMHWQNATSAPLFFTSRELILTFNSDHIGRGLGMQLELRSLPKFSSEVSKMPVYINTTSNFTTPGYPFGYSEDLDFEWKFDGGEGYDLIFQITNKNADNVLLDNERNTSITFYNGPFDSTAPIVSFNKYNRNDTEFNREFRTTSPFLTVRFETAQYRLIDDTNDTNDGIGILFTVRRVLVGENDNLTTTTTPLTVTTTTQQGEHTTTTTTPKPTTTTPPKNTRNSAQFLHFDNRAAMMAMILLISSVALYSC